MLSLPDGRDGEFLDGLPHWGVVAVAQITSLDQQDDEDRPESFKLKATAPFFKTGDAAPVHVADQADPTTGEPASPEQWADLFETAATDLERDGPDPGIAPELHQASIDGLRSQAESLRLPIIDFVTTVEIEEPGPLDAEDSKS